MSPRIIILSLLLLIALTACGAPATSAGGAASQPQRLRLATTTSTADSGLLQAILPRFEQTHNATVEVVAVGTGQALRIGESGDADVLLVHARAREDEFIANGFGTRRHDVMYNDFVIVGPRDDPAGIASASSAAAAFAAMTQARTARSRRSGARRSSSHRPATRGIDRWARAWARRC
jgi:tungstate transport system substrate-binding protein